MKVESQVQGDRKVYTVSAFNRGIASWLTRLPTVWVEGEVTEFRRQPGWQAVFFTLKDPGDGSCLPVTMSRSGFDALRLELADGMTVHVFVRPELYGALGLFQLRALTIEPLGLGVVRAVAPSTGHVVAAVGHDEDTPLCDLAADARASTPAAAARLVVPDERELRERLETLRSALAREAGRAAER